MATKRLVFPTVTAGKSGEGDASMLISTTSIDRDGDVIEPEGGDFAAYLKNPTVGWQHFRDDSVPIATTTKLEVVPGRGIRATWRWLRNDPQADRVRNAFEQGIVRAASIGFTPRTWSRLKETGGRRYSGWELNEWSLCAIPSNRESVRMLKSLGLWERGSSVLDQLPPGELIEIPDDLGIVSRRGWDRPGGKSPEQWYDALDAESLPPELDPGKTSTAGISKAVDEILEFEFPDHGPLTRVTAKNWNEPDDMIEFDLEEEEDDGLIEVTDARALADAVAGATVGSLLQAVDEGVGKALAYRRGKV